MYEQIVTLGRHRSLLAIKREYERSGCYMHDRAKHLLPQAFAQPVRAGTKAPVVIAPARALGFDTVAEYADICACAIDSGYGIGMRRLAPYMRLQFSEECLPREWPRRNVVYVPAKPMMNELGAPFIFVLCRPFGTGLLYADFAHPHTQFHPDDLFAFCAKE